MDIPCSVYAVLSLFLFANCSGIKGNAGNAPQPINCTQHWGITDVVLLFVGVARAPLSDGGHGDDTFNTGHL